MTLSLPKRSQTPGRRLMRPTAAPTPGPGQSCVRLPSLAGGANGALSLWVPGSSVGGPRPLGSLPSSRARVAHSCSTSFARVIRVTRAAPTTFASTTTHKENR
jgi:hypothetical protein